MLLSRNRRVPAFAALVVLASLTGCGFRPEPAPTHHTLSEVNRARLEEVGAPRSIENQILAILETFFGTPQEPRYMVLADWVDEGYDPNYPSYPADDRGSGEFSDEQFEEMAADNEWRFRDALAALDAGNYEAIGPFKAAPALNSDWQYTYQQFLDGESSEDEFKESAHDLFINYYPTFRDSAELFRQQCVHCHGVSGGGDGPTADFLNPRPRDYRKGVFKFVAVTRSSRPRRADLYRILSQGVYTTAMPNFSRFSSPERQGLVDMIRLLSIRGEMETQLVLQYTEENSLPIEVAAQTYADIWERWKTADENVVVYDGEVPRHSTQEATELGRALFHDNTKGNCASCHGALGRGNGESSYEERDGTLQLKLDEWGNPIAARDLTQGIYRGGGRPIDLYRRLHEGINGTPMPSMASVLSDEEMWALVAFVYELGEKPHDLRRVAAATHDQGGHGSEPKGH